MTAYKLNGKPITEKEFKRFMRPAYFDIFAGVFFALAGITLFIVSCVGFWSNNAAQAFVCLGLVFFIRFLTFLMNPAPFTITAWSFLRLGGHIMFFAGLWHHNWFFIIVGVLLSIELTFKSN